MKKYLLLVILAASTLSCGKALVGNPNQMVDVLGGGNPFYLQVLDQNLLADIVTPSENQNPSSVAIDGHVVATNIGYNQMLTGGAVLCYVVNPNHQSFGHGEMLLMQAPIMKPLNDDTMKKNYHYLATSGAPSMNSYNVLEVICEKQAADVGQGDVIQALSGILQVQQ